MLLATMAAAWPPEVSAQEPVELPTLTVEAAGDSDVGPDVGYTANRTTTGSKTDTPIDLVPQSVSVVTEQQLIDRQPEDLESALDYTAGVTPSIWGAEHPFDQFLIRGFDVGPFGIFRDGLGQKVIGFSGFRIESYGAQRVEVLRGPAGTLYGENYPGGMINIITKRPQFTPFREAAVGYGSFDTVEGRFDFTGPIGDRGTLAYRLTGLFRDGSESRENSQNDRNFLAPALTWAPDDDTTLTILANVQDDRMSPGFFLPVAGEDYPASEGELPGSFADVMPEWNRFDAKIASIGYLFEKEFDAGGSVVQNVRYSRQKTDYREFSFSGMADDATMNFAAFTVDETATAFVADNRFVTDLGLGPTETTLLLGADYSLYTADGPYGWDDGFSNPDYLIPIADPSYDFEITDPPTYQDEEQTVEQFGLYVQTQTQIGARAHLTLGMRQAWVDNRTDDHLTGVSSSQKDDQPVGNIGLAYALDNGVTPYAGYSTGFVTNLGRTFDGTPFEPSNNEQVEVGVKYRPVGFDGFFTAALFDITTTNVLTTDPDHPGFSVQTGEVRHRGLELEGTVDLGNGLSAVAAYSYLDAEITSSNDGDEGNRPTLVPETQASLWADYSLPEGPLDGLSFGAGIRYVGQTFGDTANAVSVPSYTLVDAAVRYRRGRVKGSVNATNVFDEDYFATCYAGGGCTRGDERQLLALLTISF
jgi:iron complex outermembrane receptor protein